jgi:hypothetical protein
MRLALFLAVFLAFHAVLLLKWVKPQVLFSLRVPFYVSQGSILITPSSAQAFSHKKGSRRVSQVAMWLSSPQLLGDFLRRRQVYTRAFRRLARRPPGLDAETLADYCKVVPVYTNTRIIPNPPFPVEQKLLRDWQAPLQGLEKSEKVTMLLVSALGESPAAAQERVAALLWALQSSLREVASEEVSLERKQLQARIRTLLTQLARSEKAFGKIKKLDIIEGESEQARLQVVRAELRSKIRLLLDKMDAVENIPQLDPFAVARQTDQDETLDQLAAAKELYQPDSRQVTVLQERLNRFAAVSAEVRRSRTQAQLLEHSAALSTYQRNLAEVEQQIARIQQRTATEKEQRALLRVQRNIALWEAEVLQLETQLFLSRIEEGMSRSDSGTEILHSPSKGQLYTNPVKQINRRLRLSFILLPLSLFCAMGAVLLWEVIVAGRRRVAQVEEMLDAPVLVILPPLATHVSRQWDEQKAQTKRGE